MGVPRFFRWLSERYPCIMEYVDPNTCPEFDNLYLDMNGIIHNCSHPSDDVHFRLPEDVVFRNIVAYVDYLFNMIAPKKVLFLSVDGVAPRSKMNQQRSRRYKSAMEAMDKEAKARANNEALPTTPRFDSNCITPGTAFMEKLHSYMLEEFAKRVQNSFQWKNVEIIYSGFDVPGEGEHKIMDYLRVCKSKDKTEAEEIRHCLYGLDADLINLGLSSHEPFFSILREEVKFGKQNNKNKTGVASVTKFQLLHLSILRDYLDIEFSKLKTSLKKFNYNLENIIDDWILMNFLIGNDFLPHVPMFHVEKGSLEILYKTYLKVLPTLDGYMNINGKIHMHRFNKFLEALAIQDLLIYKKNFIEMEGYADALNALTFGDSADSEVTSSPDGETSSAEFTDFEELIDEEDLGSDEDMFASHKKCYYQEKLHFKENLQEQVVEIANEYIRGLQWVLYYYYRGCPSWNWYYPYYYSPYVSDLPKFDCAEVTFTLSEPFPPLVQLLAVLPVPSKNFLPYVFQNLVGNEVSPLAKFFPEKVELDYNEKKQDYEAIVLIPFIEERLIMATYDACKASFNKNELKRNVLGFHHSLTYSEDIVNSISADDFKSKFPNVKFTEYSWNDFILDWDSILYGLRKNINLNIINGFPTMKGVKYRFQLTHARLKIYNFPTKDLSVILHIDNCQYSDDDLKSFTNRFFNQIVYINWPLIYEAKLVEVMTKSKRFFKTNSSNQLIEQENEKENWGTAYQGALSYCNKLNSQRGIHFENPRVVAKVYKLESQRFIIFREKCILEKKFAEKPTFLPLELLVSCEESLKKPPAYKDLRSVFVPGKQYFLIGKNYYGVKAEVVKYVRDGIFGCVIANIFLDSEPNFNKINQDVIFKNNYLAEGVFLKMASKRFDVPSAVIQKLLGSIIVGVKSKTKKRLNIGLKFRYQQKCLPGYSWAEQYQDHVKYYFNQKCFDIIKQYHDSYPFVFEMLKSVNTYDQIDLQTIMPDISYEEKSETALNIKAWIDALEHSQLDHLAPLVPYIDTAIVKEIENCVRSHVSKEVIVQATLTPREFFIPEFVLRGDIIPDPRTNYHLFDRIVNVKKNCSVPFGEKGTVIGIYQKMDLKEYSGSEITSSDLDDDDLENTIIEVVFDNEVAGGYSVRSSASNVARMKPSWMINITFGASMKKNSPNPLSALVRNSTSPMPNPDYLTSKAQTQTSSVKNIVPTINPSSFLKQALNIESSPEAAAPAPSIASSKILESLKNPKRSDILEQLKMLILKINQDPQTENVEQEQKDENNLVKVQENSPKTVKVNNETPKSKMLTKVFKPKTTPKQSKTIDEKKETPSNIIQNTPEKAKSSKNNIKSDKKDIKMKNNMFVPTSVQRKAAPKAKTNNQTSDQLINHSVNSPFKSLTKKQPDSADHSTFNVLESIDPPIPTFLPPSQWINQ